MIAPNACGLATSHIHPGEKRSRNNPPGDETMPESNPVKVFSFWTFDSNVETPTLAPFKATREAIATKWKGKVAEGTEQVVSEDELDRSGRYRRIASGWGELA